MTTTLIKSAKKKKKNQWSVFFKCNLFVWARYKSLYIYINSIDVNINDHCLSWHEAGPRVSFLLSANVRVSPAHGLIIPSLRIKRIHMQTEKTIPTPEPYSKFSYLSTVFIHKGSLVLCHMVYLNFFTW